MRRVRHGRPVLRHVLPIASLVVALLAVALLAGLPQTPSGASVAAALTSGYDRQVFGDFLLGGNAVVWCPAPGPARCPASGQRLADGQNNDFDMHWIDGDSTHYDSSTISLTIPPGASVDFARLSWGGSTGVLTDGSGAVRAASYCETTGVSARQPAILPPASAAAQRVALSVDGRADEAIAAQRYTADPVSSLGPNVGQLYSAMADVTGSLTGVRTGVPVTIRASDVWAPQGYGCAGGWSLLVVYKYAARNLTYAPVRREVAVYDGHDRQVQDAPPVSTRVSGFTASGDGAVEAGVTAYEGDWADRGDQLLINGVAQADPLAPSDTDNFFVSDAQHALVPDPPNNFSVDAKTITLSPSVLPAGSTSATLTTSTTGDGYLVQQLVLSIPVLERSVSISQTVSPATARAGDPVTYTISVTNTGDVALSGVAVADPVVPACASSLGQLAAGQAVSYACSTAAPLARSTNVATVTGSPPSGPNVSASSTSVLDVSTPAIVLTARTSTPVVRAGDPASFVLSVRNSGDSELRDVTVSDPTAPGCATTVSQLPPHVSVGFSCSMVAPAQSFTNTASATGQPAVGMPVTAAASAAVTVVHPGLSVSQHGPAGSVVPGQQVTIAVTIVNTGDTPLSAVATTATVPGCGRSLGTVPAGASVSYGCAAVVGPNGLVDVLTVSSPDAGDGTPFAADSALTIRFSGTDGSGTVLAATGVAAAPMLGFAGLLVVAGLALMAAGRRRGA